MGGEKVSDLELNSQSAGAVSDRGLGQEGGTAMIGAAVSAKSAFTTDPELFLAS